MNPTQYRAAKRFAAFLSVYNKSWRLLNACDRVGKMCACCDRAYGKYELTLMTEPTITEKPNEYGKLYVCNVCKLLVDSFESNE